MTGEAWVWLAAGLALLYVAFGWQVTAGRPVAVRLALAVLWLPVWLAHLAVEARRRH